MPIELIIALALSAILAISLLLILKPVRTEKFFLSKNNSIDPMVSKLVDTFGGDILTLLPDGYLKDKGKLREIELNIRRAANPWDITPQEYLILRIVTRVIGIVLALFAFFITIPFESFLIFPNPFGAIIVSALVFYLSFIYVDNTHKAIADEREKEFLIELPEAIDFLVMAISGGGYTLASAFPEVVKYMKPSVVREEFLRIVSDLRAGQTMSSALESFAHRAPSEGVKAFSKALNNANALSVSTVEILKARARASRLELNNEINKKIIGLPTKMTLYLSPTTLGSLMIVVGAPALFTLMGS